MQVKKRTEKSFKWKSQRKNKNSSNLMVMISKSDSNIKKY